MRNVHQLIQREKNASVLLHRACEILTETRGCRSAWIGLLDGDGRTITATAATGLDGKFEALRERLARGEFSVCMRQALARLVALSQSTIPETYRTQRMTKQGAVVQVSIVSSAVLDATGRTYSIATTERMVASGVSDPSDKPPPGETQ